MPLEIIRTTRLVGNLMIGPEVVKTYTVDIDAAGVSTVNEWIARPDLYDKNRSEMRKQEREFRDRLYEIEDAIAAVSIEEEE